MSEHQRKHLLNTLSVWQSEVNRKQTKNYSKNEFRLKQIAIADKKRLLSHNYEKRHECSNGNNKKNSLFTAYNRNLHFANEATIVKTPILFTSSQITNSSVQYPIPKFQFNHPHKHLHIYKLNCVHHKEISILVFIVYVDMRSNSWHSSMIYSTAFPRNIPSKETHIHNNHIHWKQKIQKRVLMN